MTSHHKAFGSRLVQGRKRFGWTQCELAAVAHVPRGSVANWEQGRLFPNIPRLIRLAQVLHVTVDWLLGVE
jgi:transcriptional regulator with XRE-family HTH domain